MGAHGLSQVSNTTLGRPPPPNTSNCSSAIQVPQCVNTISKLVLFVGFAGEGDEGKVLGQSQTGSCGNAAGLQRLARRMKSMCVTVGCAWRLCKVRPVHPAEGMWMHTPALLPLPLGHNFVDNEISVPSESV